MQPNWKTSFLRNWRRVHLEDHFRDGHSSKGRKNETVSKTMTNKQRRGSAERLDEHFQSVLHEILILNMDISLIGILLNKNSNKQTKWVPVSISLQNAELYKAKQILSCRTFQILYGIWIGLWLLEFMNGMGLTFVLLRSYFAMDHFLIDHLPNLSMSWLFLSNSAGVNILNALKLKQIITRTKITVNTPDTYFRFQFY